MVTTGKPFFIPNAHTRLKNASTLQTTPVYWLEPKFTCFGLRQPSRTLVKATQRQGFQIRQTVVLSRERLVIDETAEAIFSAKAGTVDGKRLIV